MKCSRCGAEIPRTDARQTRCKPCQATVDQLIAADTKRRQPRFAARDLTGNLR